MLLMHEAAGTRKEFFKFHSATVTTDLTGESKADDESSKAVVDIEVDRRRVQSHQTGNGPVHALANAFRDVLELAYPELREVRLVDYKVRILSSGNGFAATVRVLVQATDGRQTWGTVGVSTNIVEASRKAVIDALEAKLLRERRVDAPSTSVRKVG
jgi:2-isopropylmalate synthase